MAGRRTEFILDRNYFSDNTFLVTRDRCDESGDQPGSLIYCPPLVICP